MTSFVGNHGLAAVFVLMFVAAVLPAASELTMVYGGALASGALAGHIGGVRPGFHAYVAIVVTGVVANLCGAVFGWALGRYGGHSLLERHGRLLHATPERIARAERWFARFGVVAVPLGFATPIVRSFVALPAGILEWPLRRLLPLAASGCIVFCATIAGIGWAVGSSWHSASHDLRYLDYAVVALVVAAAASWLLWRRRSSTLGRHGDPSR
ncbi:MAG TPA: DedA family protein [Gaiellaceae bacterium]|nr:DedA family protein [Gaiellaceae bacterium]